MKELHIHDDVHLSRIAEKRKEKKKRASIYETVVD